MEGDHEPMNWSIEPSAGLLKLHNVKSTLHVHCMEYKDIHVLREFFQQLDSLRDAHGLRKAAPQFFEVQWKICKRNSFSAIQLWLPLTTTKNGTFRDMAIWRSHPCKSRAREKFKVLLEMFNSIMWYITSLLAQIKTKHRRNQSFMIFYAFS